MAEGMSGQFRVAAVEGAVAVRAGVTTAEPAATSPTRRRTTPGSYEVGRRRFTIAALVAMALTSVPFIWILWALWGPANPLRPSNYQDNFYDLQARAMFHGHLWLANGAIGLEAFVHGGHQYTYFGLFPSIIRMPVLAVTSSLDGKLTCPYMILAWLVTGSFASLLIWRVRLLVRGPVGMGSSEAGAYGLLVASAMGGTIWMLLAATPFVFNEDIAWSICLTIGSIFALLGVIERPSWGRVSFAGLLILCANLDRSTTGWACAVAAGLIAVWFLLGRWGRENRKWFLPVLATGVIPVVISCVVNYSKFGVLFGVSNYEQVWTHMNVYRRKFLAANHNAEEGVIFVPTNLLTYFRPDGIRFTSVFPFITLPAAPPTAVGGVLFDRLYRTASLPASSLFLFLLSIWGLVTAFRPRPLGKVALTRILLLAAGSAGAALMLWGYIAPRYMGDFVPFLVLASAVAMADIWRRLRRRKRSIRLSVLAAIALIAVFGIVANIAMAITPNEEWNSTQALAYVQTQKDISDLTGHPLASNVVRGDSLPPWGPADELYVIGDCSGMYVSTGENYATVPSEDFVRTTWLPVELGHAFQHTFQVTVSEPTSAATQTVAMVGVGQDRFVVNANRTGAGNQVLLTLGLYGPHRQTSAGSLVVRAGSTHTVVVVTDPVKHQAEMSLDGTVLVSTTILHEEPIYVALGSDRSSADAPALTVRDVTASTPQPTLCQSLIH
jgi:multisubunit Na+/H+ antiporter MnhB subunit